MKKLKVVMSCPFCMKALDLMKQESFCTPSAAGIEIKYCYMRCKKCMQEVWEDDGETYTSKKDRFFKIRYEVFHEIEPRWASSPQTIVKKRKPKETP